MKAPGSPNHVATLGRLAARTVRPASNRLVDVLGLLAIFGVGASLTWGSWQASLIVFLLVVVALLGQAAYGLQRMEDVRSSPRFSVDALKIEPLGAPGRLPNDGRRWFDLSALWVEVKNNGPAARFAGRIADVSRIEQLGTGEIHDDYGGFDVAWEHTLERTWEIFRGDTARLMVAWHGQFDAGHESGRGMWFWTPRSDIWAPDTHGVGWRLRPLDRRLRFNLTVINLAQDAEVTETFVVEFDDDEGLAAFHQLTDAL